MVYIQVLGEGVPDLARMGCAVHGSRCCTKSGPRNTCPSIDSVGTY